MTALTKWDAWEARAFPDDSGRPVPDPQLDDQYGLDSSEAFDALFARLDEMVATLIEGAERRARFVRAVQGFADALAVATAGRQIGDDYLRLIPERPLICDAGETICALRRSWGGID